MSYELFFVCSGITLQRYDARKRGLWKRKKWYENG